MTYLVALAFFAILASLAVALLFMLRGGSGGPRQSRRMARALALLVGHGAREAVLTIAGVALVAFAHWQNLRAAA